jgi:hypothetical protein
MPRVGFETWVPASAQAKTVHALHHSATVTGFLIELIVCNYLRTQGLNVNGVRPYYILLAANIFIIILTFVCVCLYVHIGPMMRVAIPFMLLCWLMVLLSFVTCIKFYL